MVNLVLTAASQCFPRHPFGRLTGIERTQARAWSRCDRSEAGANRGGRRGGSAQVVAQGAAVSAEHDQVGALGDGGSMVFFNDPVRRAPTSFSEGPRGVEFGRSIVIPRTTGIGAALPLTHSLAIGRICPLPDLAAHRPRHLRWVGDHRPTSRAVNGRWGDTEGPAHSYAAGEFTQ
jgi:hypothetical protein